MKLIRWGDSFPFVEYVINRFFCDYCDQEGYEDDYDEFLQFLLDHHVSADPHFPDEFTTGEGVDQLYLTFIDSIEELVIPLFQLTGMEERIDAMSNRQRVILACELIVIDFLSRAGDYVFNPSNFKLTVKYVEALDI